MCTIGSHIKGVKVENCVLCLEKDSRVKGSDNRAGNSSDGTLDRSSGGIWGSMLGVSVADKRVERGGSEKGSANDVGSLEMDDIDGEVQGGHQQ